MTSLIFILSINLELFIEQVEVVDNVKLLQALNGSIKRHEFRFSLFLLFEFIVSRSIHVKQMKINSLKLLTYFKFNMSVHKPPIQKENANR